MSTKGRLIEQFREADFERSLREALAGYLPRQRWYTAKGKELLGGEFEQILPLEDGSVIGILRVRFADGADERYQLPLALLTDPDQVDAYQSKFTEHTIYELGDGSLVVDAVPLQRFRNEIYRVIRAGWCSGEGLQCDVGTPLSTAPASAPSTVPDIDTSNTAILYGDRFFYKLFRKLDVGLNPDLELVRFLSEHAGFQHSPPYAGAIGVGDIQDPDYLNLGMLSGKIENRGDAWAYFQTLTERFYAGDGTVNEETISRAELLGQRTAQMHKSLARGAGAGAMLGPEKMSDTYRQEIAQAAQKLLDRQFRELSAKLPSLNPGVATLARELLDARNDIQARLEAITERPLHLDLIRIHGDYHLGQVLVTKDDFYIIDFEGEPLLTIPERRRKRPALKDVAGMIRSFHYAAHGQLLLNSKYSEERTAEFSDWGEHWYEQVSKAYLRAYFAEADDASFLPACDEDRQLLLNFFILEKAIYEVAYELNARLDWLAIPLHGALRTLRTGHQ